MRARLILPILILSLFLPVTNVFAVSRAEMDLSENASARYDYIVEFFTKTGVLDEEFAKIYEPEMPLGKETVNEIFTAFLGTDFDCGTSGTYMTIESVAVELVKTYNGYVTDNFPKETVLKEASRIGLLDKLKSTAYSREVTAEICIQLLYNAANTKIYYQNDEMGDSYMERMGYRELEGIVTANEHTALDTKAGLGEGNIRIGNEVFKLENAVGLLGYEVSVTADEDDNILSYMLTKNNSTLTVMSEDINKRADSSYFYYEEDGKSKKVKLNREYIPVYNGILRFRKDDTLLLPALGRITLIDNDGDKAYDVMLTESYKVIKVESIDRDNEVIVSGAENVRLDLKNKEYNLYVDGDDANVTDMPKDCVLYYGFSEDEEYVILRAATQTDECVVGDINSDGKNSTVTIDGEEYGINSAKLADIYSGHFAKVYFGAFGRIEYVEYISGYHYGIIKSLRYDMENDEYKLNFLDESGKMVSKYISEKCKFYSDSIYDVKFGEACVDAINSYVTAAYAAKPAADSYGYGMAAPIFMYLERNDEIRKLSLPSLYDENKIGKTREPFVLQSSSSDSNMLYKSSENLFRIGTKAFYATYRDPNLCDNINKFTRNSTIVFDLMVNKDKSVDRERLESGKVYTASELSMDPWMYGSFYNLDEGNIADVVVVYNMRANDALDGYVIVTGRSMAEHPVTGEVMWKIKAYKGKKEVEYWIGDDTVINMNMTGFVGDKLELKKDNIKKGDFVALSTDDDGIVTYMTVYARGVYTANDYKLYHDANHIEATAEKMFGKVKRLASGTMTVELGNNAANNKMTNYSFNTYQSATVYIYDGEGVTVGSASDICVGDYVFMRLRESIAQEIIIWRNY